MGTRTTSEVVGALEEVWDSTLATTGGLSESQWRTETACPGWDVADNLSHLIGIELSIEGTPVPDVEIGAPAHVKNSIGETNERWVVSRRGQPGSAVRAEFAEVTQRRITTLRSQPESAFDEIGWSPVGQVPMRTFMEIRIMDSWLHEQDIRHALGRPGGIGGVGEQISIERADLALGVVVGKGARAPEGASVAIELLGPLGGRRGREVQEGRAVPLETSGATVTITMTTETYVRRFGGRISGADAAGAEGTKIEGDVDLGRAVLEALGVMI